MKFQIIPKSCFNLKTYIDNIDNKKRIIIKETFGPQMEVDGQIGKHTFLIVLNFFKIVKRKVNYSQKLMS